MENYEQKYKEALERARKINSGDGVAAPSDYTICETIFPELKESEDEMVRKHLLKHFMAKTKEEWNGMPIKNIIAWLEKKGEQKPVLNNALKEAFDKSRKDYSLEEKKEVSDYSESIIPTSIAYGESEEEYMLHKIIEAAFIAGQNTKQKPTDKVEPKFHEGDIIIHKELGGDYIHNSHKIIQVDILDKKYRLEGGLVAHFSEQDDYELIEHKPAWSEEDETMCQETIDWFEKKCFPYALESENPARESIKWLKSLKERMKGE